MAESSLCPFWSSENRCIFSYFIIISSLLLKEKFYPKEKKRRQKGKRGAREREKERRKEKRETERDFK
jgi:hypothetical protein